MAFGVITWVLVPCRSGSSLPQGPGFRSLRRQGITACAGAPLHPDGLNQHTFVTEEEGRPPEGLLASRLGPAPPLPTPTSRAACGL